MKWSGIKWILIVLLLLGNLLLLGLYRERRAESQQADRQAEDDLLAVFSQNGIALGEGVKAQLPLTARKLYVRRDPGREDALSQSFLGDTTRSDQGGHIHEYTSPDGRALFRSGGQFQVEWVHARPQGAVAEDACARLAQAGFPDEPPLVLEEDGEWTLVTLSQWVSDHPVFDAFVRLYYQNGTPVSMSGQWLWGEALPADNDTPCPPLSATLLRFVGKLDDLDLFVAQVTQAQLGYMVSDSSPEYAELSPVWQIEVDGQVYYVNAWSGGVVNLETP